MYFYREQLEKAAANNIDIIKLAIASEVNFNLQESELSFVDDEVFEDICENVYTWVKNSEASVNETSYTFVRALKENLITPYDLVYEEEKVRNIINELICQL